MRIKCNFNEIIIGKQFRIANRFSIMQLFKEIPFLIIISIGLIILINSKWIRSLETLLNDSIKFSLQQNLNHFSTTNCSISQRFSKL